MPAKAPRFAKADKIGKLTVVEVIGHSNYHPTTRKFYTKHHWWYWTICDCGSTDVRNQDSLIRPAGNAMCSTCAQDASRHRVAPRPTTAGPVPDFATMKLR